MHQCNLFDSYTKYLKEFLVLLNKELLKLLLKICNLLKYKN